MHTISYDKKNTMPIDSCTIGLSLFLLYSILQNFPPSQNIRLSHKAWNKAMVYDIFGPAKHVWHIADDNFKRISWLKISVFGLKCHWRLSQRHIDNKKHIDFWQHLFRELSTSLSENVINCSLCHIRTVRQITWQSVHRCSVMLIKIGIAPEK